MIGTLGITSRPLRLGFLVDPKKITSIKKAIEINSTIWGGAYNPLIPVYKGTPRWEKPFKSPKPEEIVKGYIEAFDPDILVQCTNNLPTYIKDLGLEIVQPHEIWEKGKNPEKDIYPKIGIGIFELFNEIYNEHFRYQEKYPPKIVIPKIPRANSLFWSSVFGILPEFIIPTLNAGYKKALEIKKQKIDTSKLEASFKGNVLFPRRITQYALRSRKRSGFRNEACIFFMDMTKNLDIIDYWNLRALGRQVIPVPIQLKDEKSLRNIVVKVVKASRRPLRGNPNIYNHATFIRSRSSKMEDLQEFAKSLDIKDPSSLVKEPFYSLQHWYPRIWDDWARSKDGAEADDIFHEEKSIDLNDIKESVPIRFVVPEFLDTYYGSNEARIANEVSFEFYGRGKMLAQVYPKSHQEHFMRLLGGLSLSHKEWRVGRNGLVKQVQNYGRTENWDFPMAEEVMAAWMKDLGYEIKTSTPGLLAKQIYTQLEGSVRVLADEKLLQLFERMNKGNDEGKELHVDELKNHLGERKLNYLLSKNVFRIGLRIQCTNCQRHSWYPLDSIKENLTCPKCLNNYRAIGHIHQGHWCYKTAGPFSLPQYADGAYCVLMAVEFFDDHMFTMKVTPALSFEADDKKGTQLEADFGILFQESQYGEVMDGIIFGECKTFGTFDQKDYRKMRLLAKKFPGAILVFCTLRSSLTPSEIKEITKIAKAGRKRWKSERPINPVLILTGNELMDMSGPPYCWNKKYGKKYERVHGLLEIADATQQIYLNLPSWHTDWQKDFEEKRKKWEEKNKKAK